MHDCSCSEFLVTSSPCAGGLDVAQKESPELHAALMAFWPTILGWVYGGRRGSPQTYTDCFLAGWDAHAALGRQRTTPDG